MIGVPLLSDAGMSDRLVSTGENLFVCRRAWPWRDTICWCWITDMLVRHTMTGFMHSQLDSQTPVICIIHWFGLLFHVILGTELDFGKLMTAYRGGNLVDRQTTCWVWPNFSQKEGDFQTLYCCVFIKRTNDTYVVFWQNTWGLSRAQKNTTGISLTHTPRPHRGNSLSVFQQHDTRRDPSPG